MDMSETMGSSACLWLQLLLGYKEMERNGFCFLLFLFKIIHETKIKLCGMLSSGM
jgi:hypothetical protein